MKRFLLYLIPHFFLSLTVFPQVESPGDPVIPEIVIPEGETKKNEVKHKNIYPAAVFIADGSEFHGTISLSSDQLDTSVRKFLISEIESISVEKWKTGKSMGGVHFFVPSHLRIKLRNGDSVFVSGNFSMIHRIDLSDKTGKKHYYTCFYDRRKKGKWENSSQKDIKYPETNPHGSAVVRILFKKSA